LRDDWLNHSENARTTRCADGCAKNSLTLIAQPTPPPHQISARQVAQRVGDLTAQLAVEPPRRRLHGWLHKWLPITSA
jgi:hypothetical protein